ncbi:MAG: 50S ribosomal protein L9 [Geminicoccaceae bacterium]
MQVVLLERIEKLGQMGDLVTVKSGFARNYLVPQGKAMRATKTNLAEFERRKVELEATNIKRRDEAQALRGQIDGRSVVIIRQAGETGHLYGSVNSRDIADAFGEDGVNFDRRQVRLAQPLKTLGLHEVRVALHPEVDVHVKVNVARSEEEAEIQADPNRAAAYAAALAAEAAEAAEELADMGAELREAEGDEES